MCYYQLRRHPSWLSRNAFGKRVGSSLAAQYGGRPGRHYRLALAVIVLGDGNGIDLSDIFHEALLKAEGCLCGHEPVVYKLPLPSWRSL